MAWELVPKGKPGRKPKPKPRCPSCDSTQILYTKKDQRWWCRICGAEWKEVKGSLHEKRDSRRSG
jgi:transposase-like protein